MGVPQLPISTIWEEDEDEDEGEDLDSRLGLDETDDTISDKTLNVVCQNRVESMNRLDDDVDDDDGDEWYDENYLWMNKLIRLVIEIVYYLFLFQLH